MQIQNNAWWVKVLTPIPTSPHICAILWYQLDVLKFNSILTCSTLRLEKAMAPDSSTLAWKIPWMEKPGRLQSMGSLTAGHNWSDLAAAAAATLRYSISACSDAKFCLTPGNPMDCSLTGSSVHGISQARILEWVAHSFSRRCSWPRDWPRFPALQADSLPLNYLWSPTPSLVLINFLKRLTEGRETFYLLDHQFIIKGHNSELDWRRK